MQVDKFTLEKQDAENFTITATNPKLYHCFGFCLLCINGVFYIQNPKNVNEGTGFKIRKGHLIQTLYNWFEEPNTEEVKKVWRKMFPSEIKKALEINDEAMRQLHLDCFWGFDKSPKLKAINNEK